jgi:two-component system response regulator DegU
MTLVRVLVVDDHQLFRDGIRSLFDHDPGVPRLEVVAEADRAHAAYGAAARGDVDVVMLDIGLEGVHGLTALRELKRREVRAPVLMVSTYADDHVVAEAFSCGAAGYVHKNEAASALTAAVRTIAGGGRWVHPELAVEEPQPDACATSCRRTSRRSRIAR